MGLILIIIIVVLFIPLLGANGDKWFGSNTYLDKRPPGDSALEILKKRYARGEISREDYLARRSTLIH